MNLQRFLLFVLVISSLILSGSTDTYGSSDLPLRHLKADDSVSNESSSFNAVTTSTDSALAATVMTEQALLADVPTDWWSIVQEDIDQSEYYITWQDRTHLSDLSAAYQAPNRAHNLRTYFTPTGIRVIPRDTADASKPIWEWGLTLTHYGHPGDLMPTEPAQLTTSTNRVEYSRGNLTEWYVNNEEGLKQGFTIEAPPSAVNDEDSDIIDQSQLVLEFDISGNLAVCRRENYVSLSPIKLHKLCQ